MDEIQDFDIIKLLTVLRSSDGDGVTKYSLPEGEAVIERDERSFIFRWGFGGDAKSYLRSSYVYRDEDEGLVEFNILTNLLGAVSRVEILKVTGLEDLKSGPDLVKLEKVEIGD
ncbi:hypothetical protein [Erythrobacter aureus]|uniref:hypothetical protein n=1 Tax=Erythrobacter aureus TaxID=2182384 RepID=UPI003A9200F6